MAPKKIVARAPKRSRHYEDEKETENEDYISSQITDYDGLPPETVGSTSNTHNKAMSLVDLLGDDDDGITLPEHSSPQVKWSPTKPASEDSTAQSDPDVLVEMEDVIPILSTDCSFVRALEVQATFDLRPLIRSISKTVSCGGESDEVYQWASTQRLYSYPEEPAPSVDSIAAITGSSHFDSSSVSKIAQKWIESFQDAWQRLRSNTDTSMKRLYLIPPRSRNISANSKNGNTLLNGGPSEFERTLSVLLCCKDEKAPVRCVITGLNTPLLLRLQQLGASPRIVTIPGAVLPGVYSTNATVPNMTGLPIHIQQQRRKKIAQDTAEKHTKASNAVANYGYTVLIVGAAEVGIVVDLLCQVAFDECSRNLSANSGPSNLQLYTQIQRFPLRSRKDPAVLPILAAETSFLHSQQTPIYVTISQNTKKQSEWSASMTSLFLPKAAGLLIPILQSMQTMTSVPMKILRDEVGLLDSRIYQRAAELHKKASNVRQTNVDETKVLEAPANSSHIQIFAEKRHDVNAEDESSDDDDDDDDDDAPLYRADKPKMHGHKKRKKSLVGLEASATGFVIRLVHPNSIDSGAALAFQLVSLSGLKPHSELINNEKNSVSSSVPQLGELTPPTARTIDTLVWDASQDEDVEMATRLSPRVELHPTSMLARVASSLASHASAAAQAMEGKSSDARTESAVKNTVSVRGISGGYQYNYSSQATDISDSHYNYGNRAGMKPTVDSVIVLDGATRMNV
jgi:hypothetical protein